MICRNYLSNVLIFFIFYFGLAVPGQIKAQEVWSVGQGQLDLKMGEAKFIKLATPAQAVFLSNPSIAEIDLQSARYLYIVGKEIGSSTIFVLGEGDAQVMSTTISVGIDEGRLNSAARAASNGGTISVKAIDGAVFLNGSVETDEDATAASDVISALLGQSAIVVNRLELKKVAQVNLRVRIAEVSRSISEDLGIGVNAVSSNGKRSFTSPDPGNSGYNINIGSGSRNLNLVIDALARNGLVTILSEPNLTARSGDTANFLAGGRVPYATENENGQVSYELQPIGVELDFTPTVFNKDQIRLQIKTSVRDVDRANSTEGGAPALTERSATTTVELGSGQSFAIAGMFRADTSQSLQGLPGLSKIPILGTLFRSAKFNRGESELIIIVTPYMVEPVNSDQLQIPQNHIAPADDAITPLLTGEVGKVIRPGTGARSNKVRRGGFVLQ